MSGIVNPNRYRYQYIAPGQTLVPLGTNGGPGDYLHRLIILSNDPGNAGVTLVDGLIVMPVQVGAGQLQRGPQSVEFNIASRFGPFMITTGGGAGVIAVGQTVG